MRSPNEPTSIFAVELEATLCTIEERMSKNIPFPNHNHMLTQQFMRGVKDERVTRRIAPMRPREMTFHELQTEVRQLEREMRLEPTTKPEVRAQSQKSAQSHHYQSQPNPHKAPTTFQPPNKKTDHNILQELMVRMSLLTEKVEELASSPRRTTRDNKGIPPTGSSSRVQKHSFKLGRPRPMDSPSQTRFQQLIGPNNEDVF